MAVAGRLPSVFFPPPNEAYCAAEYRSLGDMRFARTLIAFALAETEVYFD